MSSIAFITLGCKVNIYESNALMNKFKEAGFKIVDEDDIADVYVINTCSVTNMADAKSRKMIHRAQKLNSEAIICVMGCYSQTNKDVQNIEGIDILIGNGNKSEALNLVMNALNKKEKTNKILDIRNTLYYDDLEASEFDHTRAFVKIEDGCSNFCTYCIIPYARGPVRSKDHNKVIEELKRITDLGYKEVVFSGIHTGRYESDNYKLSDLIEEVLIKVPKLKRLRLSSIEINEIDDKLLKLMQESHVLADHLHLPLQSGNDKILKLMNRKYDTLFFKDKVNKIREIRPDISITTDVIVGFPYETEEDYLKTVEFIKEINFSELHVFPYSKREGTKAAQMPQVDGLIKKKRAKDLIELSEELNYSYNKKFINTVQSVIIEQKYNEEYMVGHTSNYMKVFVPLDTKYIKSMVDVLIISVEKDKIIGKLK